MSRIIDPETMFMTLAYTAALCSKDVRTKVGAVIVGPGNEIISIGYNGLPRGANDDDEERQQRPGKYQWFEHAERNAIYNAARVGVSVNNCTIYTPYYPCSDCMRAIIQSGIKRLVLDKWRYGLICAPSDAARELADECNIEIKYMIVKIPKIVAFVREQEYSLA